MKVSIIIPVYNCKKYLAKCVNSIINQSFTNWELILVDDGSRDGSETMCDKYSAKDNRIFAYHLENRGAANARNFGLNKVTGDYCMFVDGDDYLELDAVQELVKNERKDIDVIFFPNYNDVYFNNKYEVISNNAFYNIKIDNNEEFKELYNSLMDKYYINQVWNKLYSVKFIKNNRALFPWNIKYSEDLIFNIQLYKKMKKGIVIDKPLYHFVYHRGESLCATFDIERFKSISKAYIFSLVEINKWNRESINSLNNLYINEVNSCINNLFNDDCLLDFNEKVSYVKGILKSSIVKNCVRDTKVYGKKNYITSILIRLRCKYMILLMNKIERTVKKNKGEVYEKV